MKRIFIFIGSLFYIVPSMYATSSFNVNTGLFPVKYPEVGKTDAGEFYKCKTISGSREGDVISPDTSVHCDAIKEGISQTIETSINYLGNVFSLASCPINYFLDDDGKPFAQFNGFKCTQAQNIPSFYKYNEGTNSFDLNYYVFASKKVRIITAQNEIKINQTQPSYQTDPLEYSCKAIKGKVTIGEGKSPTIIAPYSEAECEPVHYYGDNLSINSSDGITCGLGLESKDNDVFFDTASANPKEKISSCPIKDSSFYNVDQTGEATFNFAGPDGNYKKYCENISYNVRTQNLSATCAESNVQLDYSTCTPGSKVDLHFLESGPIFVCKNPNYYS